MKITMKKYIKYTLIAVLVVVSSCESWLDIKPSDRLTEEMVFSSKEGFQKALNGVYIELTLNTLYGQNLSAGVIDAMAQYYNATTTSTNSFYYFAKYTYTNAGVKSTFDQLWQKSYQMIGNCNIIIEKCGDSNPVLPDQYFGIIKGEALALRAMLHFDLLRLFGPIFSQGVIEKCIPYMTVANQEVQDLVSSTKVADSVIIDLKAAMALLKDSDPVLTEGVRNYANTSGANDLFYRQYRLNYFAVKALLARVYLWTGDKVNALKESEELLAAAQVPGAEKFPFVKNASATNATIPDRMFSTEVLFSLYNMNRTALQNSIFIPTLEATKRLSFAGTLTEGRVNEMYEDKNDYRYKIWANYNNNGTNVLYSKKFEDMSDANGVSNAWRYMMPLIRLSEVFLIASECTDDISLSTVYLNKVRNNRNCFSVYPTSKDGLMTYITGEYRREMLGEGQLFFYYKRRAMLNIQNGALVTGTMNMSLNNYIIPLPDSETSQR